MVGSSRSPIRRLMLMKRAGGSPPWDGTTFDLFVDSVNGSDSNSGATQLLPLQTIAGVQAKLADNLAIGFARGSSWREELVITKTGLKLGVYGSGAMPVLRGDDVATGWNQTGINTGLYPHVWKVTWARPTVPSATEWSGLWANGVRPRLAVTLADLQANGGWLASNNNGDPSTDAGDPTGVKTGQTSNPTFIFIKSATDPNSSGVVYEIAKRWHCIRGHASDTTVVRPTTIIGPFELKRSYGHYGCLSGPAGTTRYVLCRDSIIHHTVSQAVLVQDVVCGEYVPGYYAAVIPFTIYQSDGTAFDNVSRRIFILPDLLSTGTSIQGMYAHGSVAPPNSTYWEQVAVMAGNLSSGALTTTVLGAFLDATSGGASLGGGNSATFTHCQVRNVAWSDTGPEDSTGRTRVSRHNVFYNPTVGGPIIGVGPRTGNLTFENNTVFSGINGGTSLLSATPYTGPSGPAAGLQVVCNYNIFVVNANPTNPSALTVNIGVGGSYVGDHNLFVVPLNSAATLRFVYGGVNYDGLAAWQAATGQDAHSKVLAADPTILYSLFAKGPNGPLCGDFRVNPGYTTFTDGVDVALAGPQQRYDWNGRGIASGAARQWPVPPKTVAEGRTYEDNSTGWNFYPADVTAPTPGSITGTSTNNGTYSVTFSAGSDTDVTAGAYAPDAYIVEDGVVVAGPAITSPYTRSGRTNGQTYAVKVRYVDVAGNSADTAASNVTPNIPVVNPLLDDFPGATCAFSTRKLRTAYAGSALKVRRSSDNTELDIGFVSGQLDTASLLAFVGAGDGFVHIWYDQTANGNNATQATNGTQYKIVSAGVVNLLGAKPAVLGTGNAGWFLLTGNMGLAQPYTAFLRAANTRSTTGSFDVPWQLYTSGGSSTMGLSMSNHTASTMTVSLGGGGFTAFTNQPKDGIFYLLANGTTNSRYAANATTPATANAGTTAPDGFLRLASQWPGGIGELVIYPSDQSANQTGIRDNMNSHWGAY